MRNGGSFSGELRSAIQVHFEEAEMEVFLGIVKNRGGRAGMQLHLK